MVFHLIKHHNLVNEWVNELRNVDVQNDRMRFRRNMERIGEAAALEISKSLNFVEKEVATPLGIYNGYELEKQPIVATILRAGVPLWQGILNYFDKADCAFVAAYRKHTPGSDEFSINQEYVTCPDTTDRPLILADPMLATGASLIEALKEIMGYGKPSSIHVVCAIASTVGIETIAKTFPECNLWIADIDDELTGKGYIVPGLGDAGDLSFGSKLQF